MLNDRDLLRRFIQDADEGAFAEIVRRHQALVMGVCRRVMGSSSDVEDAFQATFITLARRPGQIRKAASLSHWLYTVAWRICIRLVRKRREYAVESLTEHPAETPPDPLEKIASDQDCLVLDEELNRLPEKYRDVLVMSYFASHSSQQIADQLGVSKGTVDGRIRQARNMLRVRLVRRGVGIGALTVAAAVCSARDAAASPALVETTIQLGAQTLSGSLPGTTDLSHLEPFIRPETTMLSSKLILSLALCATAVVGIAGMQRTDFGQNSASTGSIDLRIPNAVLASNSESTLDEELSVAVSMAVPNSIAVSSAANRGPAASVRSEPRFAEYPSDAAPLEQWMYGLLDKPVPPLDFPGETPLSEVLEVIQTHCTEEYGADVSAGARDARLTIWPDTAELELEGVTSLEDVTVRDISLDGVTVRNALELVFEQTHEPQLTWVIDREVMKITTVTKADSAESMVTRVYDVKDLVGLDVGRRSVSAVPMLRNLPGSSAIAESGLASGTRGQSPNAGARLGSAASDLATVVVEMTPTGSWAELGGDGAIRIVGGNLVVRQTHAVHREIVRLLNLLSQSERSAQN